MPVEHERKFLVTSEAWKQAGSGLLCIQGYIAKGEKAIVRVRIMGNKGFLTVKENCAGLSRLEYEYAIPVAGAEEMLRSLAQDGLIEKMRYKLEHLGKVWEIDEFLGQNKGLVIAEIELSSAEETFSAPAWLGKEVTSDSRYYNANLAARPFNTW